MSHTEKQRQRERGTGTFIIIVIRSSHVRKSLIGQEAKHIEACCWKVCKISSCSRRNWDDGHINNFALLAWPNDSKMPNHEFHKNKNQLVITAYYSYLTTEYSQRLNAPTNRTLPVRSSHSLSVISTFVLLAEYSPWFSESSTCVI